VNRLSPSPAIALLGLFLAACESSVSGHIYHTYGGVVQVEFKSGGRAYVSAGASIYTCSYSQSGKSVRLICAGDTTNFRVQDEGALVGPAEGMMARLTPLER
jgi:hypothetical protein